MIYFEIKDEQEKILASNLKDIENFKDIPLDGKIIISNKKIRSGHKETDDIFIRLISVDDKDLYQSRKLFNKALDAFIIISSQLFEYYINKIKNHSHSLKNIQGQMKQKIEGLISEKVTTKSYSYDIFKQKVKEQVSKDVDGSADVLCYLNKRIFDINVHIECFNILSLGKRGELNFIEHNIKKLLLRIAQPFFNDLKQKKVGIHFNIKDEYAKDNKVIFDYKTFNLAMYNFFDNAVKYSKPGSEINLYFEKNHNNFVIKFDMTSIRIEKDEIEKIFNEGCSGINTKNEAGDGIGMYMIKEALSLNNAELIVMPNYSKSETFNNIKYINNIFEIRNKK